MNFLIKTTLLAGALLFALSLAAWADKPALNITEVAVDVPTTGHITITGEALDFGPGPLVVTLGNLGELATFGTPDATTIVVVCPGMGPACPIAGDFLLTVSNGNGKKQNDVKEQNKDQDREEEIRKVEA